MRLKILEVQGYKSFANKVEFLFDGGITAIVGPNGSGKSNVADAIRWVLGEQSYSNLRGKKTEDMIFSGSDGRARLGLASVTLVLDNTDKWLPLDFSEVTISRRAYRSGENEYFLNGSRVRLKDVAELLTSGLEPPTYTVIGQGTIGSCPLALHAEERRRLFMKPLKITFQRKTGRDPTIWRRPAPICCASTISSKRLNRACVAPGKNRPNAPKSTTGL
ncbi:MAG: AAA family ATPase [Anaerolineae bacterium]